MAFCGSESHEVLFGTYPYEDEFVVESIFDAFQPGSNTWEVGGNFEDWVTEELVYATFTVVPEPSSAFGMIVMLSLLIVWQAAQRSMAKNN